MRVRLTAGHCGAQNENAEAPPLPEAVGLGEAPVTEGATVTRLSPLRASRVHSRTRRRGAGTHAPSASGLARADCENAPGRTSLTSVHGHLGPCPHLCKTPGGRASWEGSCGIVFKIRVFGAFLQNGSPKSRSEQQPTSEHFLTDTTSWVHGAAGRTRREGSAYRPNRSPTVGSPRPDFALVPDVTLP